MASLLTQRPLFAAHAPARSVLVYVGLDRIGDGLLKLPFVRGLRDAFPEARITWLAGKETSVYASLLKRSVEGLIDEVIENAGIGHHPSELLKKPLPGRHFDLVIDTQRIFWTSLSLMRVPHRAFISPAARFLLSSRRPPHGYRHPRGMLRQLLDLLELASARRFETPATIPLAIGDEHIEAAFRALPQGPTYIGIAPGSGGRPKCWPLPSFIAVGQNLAQSGYVPVFVLGPKEEDWRHDIAAAVPGARFPLQETEGHDYAPEFTIALARHFVCALANDSGTGHMFALAGIPLVSLYGSTVPEKFMPMTPTLSILRARDFGGPEIERIPVRNVMDAVQAFIASRSQR